MKKLNEIGGMADLSRSLRMKSWILKGIDGQNKLLKMKRDKFKGNDGICKKLEEI